MTDTRVPRTSLAQPVSGQWAPEHQQVLSRLRGVLLLAGSVRPTQLRRFINRFVLDLPVQEGRSILGCWREQVLAMVDAFGLERLPVRVMVDHISPPPMDTSWPGPIDLRFERDPSDFRGTGGLLRDVAAEYDDDDLILVAEAAQVLLEPLPVLADALAATDGDVRILAVRGGTPSGMMLIRCGCLRAIPPKGFMDLKEQALPAIAEEHTVRVCWRDEPAGVPVRTVSGYLEALRSYHRRLKGGLAGEDWRPTFSLVEPGAHVDPSVVVHDSVVLRGGRVEPAAVLVRSLVCPDGWLGVGKSAVDQLLTRADDWR